jgi:DNA polymerase-1
MEFDLPLIPVLYEMEERGMLIDRPYFEGLKEEFLKEVAGREREIWKLAGTEFNVNSPAQLSEVFFTRLGLPTKGIKKGSRGYSTGAKELDKLQKYHPIIEKIKEYREAAKLLSTYIEPIPELADKADRVHTTFNQNVTATGRLSSTNPNLQNIPVRTEVGRQIRTGFIAGPGKVLVSADYSQFELRLAAVLAGDQALIDDFNSDVDIHTKTAAEAFGVAPEDVTKTQRRAAKVINFGVLYGMSVRGLSEATGMSLNAAKDFIERYFELRKPVKEYLDKVLVQAREQGYVETYYGRRRPTPDVLSSNFIVRTGAERAAQNMPIQGTEADLMKRAMLAVKVALPKGAEMIMQVHDSLIIECDENLAEEVSKILVEKMENVAPELAVKLKAEVTIGQNWGEL